MASDPPLQPDSYLAYVPSLPGNATIGALYGLLFFVMLYRTARAHTWKWCTVQLVGLFFASLGYFLRIPLREPALQANEPLYIVSYVSVVLWPCAALAYNYILLARLIRTLDPDLGEHPKRTARSRYLVVPPRMVALVFVTSDVCTFLVQAAGGGLQTSGPKYLPTGNKIFLIGVTLQGISYLFFTFLSVTAHARLAREKKREGTPLRVRSWTTFTFALGYLSSAGIILRSVYRIIEMAQGYGGFLYSHERFTFTCDALPLLISTGVWAIWWPPTLFRHVADEAERDAAERAAHGADHGGAVAEKYADADLEKAGSRGDSRTATPAHEARKGAGAGASAGAASPVETDADVEDAPALHRASASTRSTASPVHGTSA